MYEDVAILKGEGTVTYDAAGNEIITPERTQVFVLARSVYSSEFYAAASAGLHPSITFELTNRDDYKGEKLIEWHGRDYSVIRADWTGQGDKLRLVCEERVGNGR